MLKPKSKLYQMEPHFEYNDGPCIGLKGLATGL